MRSLHRILLALVLAGALLGTPASASAQDTAAVAINTKDGADLFKFAFQVRKTMKDVVDSSNAAVAYSSCEACSTVAISFQVVLAGGDASTVTPTNVAIALNENCTSCLTAAFAYQFIVSTDGPLRLTGEGQRRLAGLRNRLRDLENQDLTIDQLAAELDKAAQEVRDVLETDLVPVGEKGEANGSPDRAPPDESGTEPSPTPEPSASPTPEGSATPAPTASPTVTAEPTATATPTPAATATPSPTP